MAEPYVPISEYNAAEAILAQKEVAINAISASANALANATTSALNSKNTALALAGQFEPLLLVGC